MSSKSGEAKREGPVSHRAPQRQRQGGGQQDRPWEGVGVGNAQQLSEAPWLDHICLPAPLPASRVPPATPWPTTPASSPLDTPTPASPAETVSPERAQ